jgi:hypothetical protein
VLVISPDSCSETSAMMQPSVIMLPFISCALSVYCFNSFMLRFCILPSEARLFCACSPSIARR